MFIEKLVQKQKELRMSDEEFSSLLGISRQLWNFTRRGKKIVGPTLISSVLRIYPDLKDDLANFLLENATTVANNASNVTSKLKAS